MGCAHVANRVIVGGRGHHSSRTHTQNMRTTADYIYTYT